jgi:hypothetical protein
MSGDILGVHFRRSLGRPARTRFGLFPVGVKRWFCSPALRRRTAHVFLVRHNKQKEPPVTRQQTIMTEPVRGVKRLDRQGGRRSWWSKAEHLSAVQQRELREIVAAAEQADAEEEAAEEAAAAQKNGGRGDAQKRGSQCKHDDDIMPVRPQRRGTRRISWWGKGVDAAQQLADLEAAAAAASGHSSDLGDASGTAFNNAAASDNALAASPKCGPPRRGISIMRAPSSTSPSKSPRTRRTSWFGRGEAVAQQQQIMAELEASGHSSDLETTTPRDNELVAESPKRGPPRRGKSIMRASLSSPPPSPSKSPRTHRMSWFGRGVAVAQQQQLAELDVSSSSGHCSAVEPTRKAPAKSMEIIVANRATTNQSAQHAATFDSEPAGNEPVDELPKRGPPGRGISVRESSPSKTNSPSTRSSSSGKLSLSKTQRSKTWWKAQKRTALR